jgi:hypothetical protein
VGSGTRKMSWVIGKRWLMVVKKVVSNQWSVENPYKLGTGSLLKKLYYFFRLQLIDSTI